MSIICSRKIVSSAHGPRYADLPTVLVYTAVQPGISTGILYGPVNTPIASVAVAPADGG